MLSSLIDGAAALVVAMLNALIAALGALLAGLVSLLPNMPDLPTLPSGFGGDDPGPFERAYSWVAWFFPVSTVGDILVFVLSMWLLWQLVALGLRWAKAMGN